MKRYNIAVFEYMNAMRISGVSDHKPEIEAIEDHQVP